MSRRQLVFDRLIRTIGGGIYEIQEYVAAEIFLDLNLPSEERKFEVQAIIDTLEAEVKKAEAELT
jgi:hypothetical protein